MGRREGRHVNDADMNDRTGRDGPPSRVVAVTWMEWMSMCVVCLFAKRVFGGAKGIGLRVERDEGVLDGELARRRPVPVPVYFYFVFFCGGVVLLLCYRGCRLSLPLVLSKQQQQK